MKSPRHFLLAFLLISIVCFVFSACSSDMGEPIITSMPDLCDEEYFAELGQGPKEDMDKDGYSNYVECKKGTDPNNPGAYPYFGQEPGIYYEYDALGRMTKVTVIK